MKSVVLVLVLSFMSNLLADEKIDFIKEYPVFSLTKHEKERAKVWKFLHQKNITKWDKAYLSLHDLDGDGVDEILAYVESYRVCGRQTGCYLYILKLNGTKLRPVGFKYGGIPTFSKMKIAQDGSQDFIAILKAKHNGWHKLLKPTSNNMILKYDGKYYDK